MKIRTKFWITFCTLGAIFSFATYSVYGNIILFSIGVAHSILIAFWVAIGKQESKQQKAKEGKL